MDTYTRKESFLVVLDSRNATGINNGSMNSDLTYDLSDEIRIEKDTIQLSMVVSSFTSPVSFYNVNTTNNILQLVLNGVSTTFTIPVGNHTSTSFISYLSSLLPLDFTIILNTLTNKIVINTISSTFTIKSTSTIYEIMGFAKNTNYSNVAGSQFILPFCVNFSGLSSFNIHIDNIRTRNIDSLDLSVSNICACVPVNAPPNGVIYYEKKNDFSIIVRESTIDYFDITLKDDLGNLLDLNNQHYNLVLQFDIISDIPKNIDSFHQTILNAYN